MAADRSFLNAVKWAYTGNWGERAFSALFTFILAAILGPREFGTVSIALVYISFLQMFLDQGLVAALIQRKNLEPEHLDTVFWMDISLSLGLIAISMILSHWWAVLNHAPQVSSIISVLSVCILLEALAIVQCTLLKRNMNFRGLSIRTNASVLAGGVVGLAMAFAGFGVWALVGQQIAKGFIAVLLLWKINTWRPHFRFSWKHLNEMMSFSVSNFVAQLGIFADTQASSILLGLFFGPAAVGLYRLADRLMNSVVAMATSSVQAVSLPEFSRHQDNPAELRKAALSCIRLSSAVTLPALAGLAAVSTPLIECLGPKWGPTSGVLKVLCAFAVAVIFAYFTGPLLQALGRTGQLAALEWARMAVGSAILVLVGLFVRHSSLNIQLIGIAWARLATTLLFVTPVFVYVLMRLCKITLRDLVVAVGPSALSGAAVVMTVFALQASGVLAPFRPIMVLITETFFGGAVGLTVLLALDSQLRGVTFNLVQRTLRSQNA